MRINFELNHILKIKKYNKYRLSVINLSFFKIFQINKFRSNPIFDYHLWDHIVLNLNPYHL